MLEINKKEISAWKIVLFFSSVGFLLISLLFALFFGISWMIKEYNVWAAGMEGKAELNQAEWSRQIAVREAQAKRDSAVMLAQAEVERAQGVAAANKIIGQSLNNNEAYLRYLWIDGLQNTKDQVIYVPTEGQLPVLEANRLQKPVVVNNRDN